MERQVVDDDRRLEAARHPGRDHGGFGLRRVREQDGELVAPKPRHRVTSSGQRRKPPGHLPQHLVPDCVAKGVIDLLEPVDVEHQKGELLVPPPRLLEGVLHPSMEQHPVRQAREPVVQSLVPELFFGFVTSFLGELLHCDVPDQEADPPRKALRTDDRSEPALEPPDARRDLQAVLTGLGATRLENMADGAGQAQTDIFADGLANCPAEHLAPGRGQQGVVGGPDPQVRAVLVELEHKIVE